MSDNEKINHLLERAGPVRLSPEEERLQWSIKRKPWSTGGSALSVHCVCVLAGDWVRDTSASRPCNKRVLRPGHHSKAALRETNIITGNARVCALKRPESEWSPMGFHRGQEGQR
ncbi:hypothetical protein NQZ68_008364%2C partial [Xyrichtys novacula]|uniref:Uncharacterized protein n=1 Tax=Xyrichtys novacula TaxID=13765 RepID=A0AAV1GV08_XYRNO|nr:hypothetical protein NQZ68_008364%2C partial [Xyrichtys novacula]